VQTQNGEAPGLDPEVLHYPHALYTAARYDLDLTVVIPDNRNYRVLKDNAIELFDDVDPAAFDAGGADGTDGHGGGDETGGPGPLAGVDFDPPVDLPANARSHGARGRLVEDPDAIEAAVREALDRPGPDVLDVLVHD
jgi:benzoylformate decarboxylase